MNSYYWEQIKRFRSAGIIHTAFDLYFGDALPDKIKRAVGNEFDIVNNEGVFLVRHFYSESKAEYYVAITKKGLYVSDMGRTPVVLWAEVSEILVKSSLLFLCNNRILFECSNNVILPTGNSDKIASLLRPLFSYKPNRDSLSTHMTDLFETTFSKYRTFADSQDSRIVKHGGTLLFDDYLFLSKRIYNASVQDFETILLYRDATRWSTDEFLIITDRRFYVWTSGNFYSVLWSKIYRVTSQDEQLLFYGYDGNTLIQLPLYNIIKRKKALFEDKEVINTTAKQVAASFNAILAKLGKEMLSDFKAHQQLVQYPEMRSLSVHPSPICPKCGSVNIVDHYSQKFLEREKTDKAKHVAKEVASELLSYWMSGKPSPYSQYERKSADEYQCSKCGNIWRK